METTNEAFQDGDGRGRITCFQCGVTADMATEKCPNCGDSLAEEKKVKLKIAKKKGK